MGAGVKTFLKIAASVFALLAAVAAYGVYELWPEPYKPTYTVDLPMLNGVPGVVLAVEDPKSELAIKVFGGVLEAKFRGEPIEGFWQPSEQQLVGFEKALRQHVYEHPPSDAVDAPAFLRPFLCNFNEGDQLEDLLQNSFRQYVGIEVDGQKFMRVKGAPRDIFETLISPSEIEETSQTYLGMHDGGPTDFNALYSFDEDRIVWLFYNSYYGGLTNKC